MKIVKFKDGTYGVRKWSIFGGYQFLSMVDNKGAQNHWWCGDNFLNWAKTPTESIAMAKLEAWKSRKSSRPDIGVSV